MPETERGKMIFTMAPMRYTRRPCLLFNVLGDGFEKAMRSQVQKGMVKSGKTRIKPPGTHASRKTDQP